MTPVREGHDLSDDPWEDPSVTPVRERHDLSRDLKEDS